jgi:NAD(P)-dependent dehydrogenase (short-subunit alcohol dehydrogenase family)
MAQQKTALVLGATGGIGGELARTLVAHGWQVMAMARKLASAPTCSRRPRARR